MSEELKKDTEESVKENENQEDVVLTEEVEVEEVSEVEIIDNSKEMEELENKLSEAEDRILRLQAEIQNMQTRQEKEIAQILKYDGQKLAKAILPVVDNLERALSVKADDEASVKIKQGIELTYNKLLAALDEHDIKAVGEVGESFDGNIHQAIKQAQADEDHPADTIAEVLQKGYVLHDRTLRPAMVSVAE